MFWNVPEPFTLGPQDAPLQLPGAGLHILPVLSVILQGTLGSVAASPTGLLCAGESNYQR